MVALEKVERSKQETQALVTSLGLVSPPPIHVQCDAFEGTLVALFLCVKDHKINLEEIPLAPICQAYFSYLIQSKDVSLDEAASALAALAYLLERKAWGLLPSSEEPPEELEIEGNLSLISHIDEFEEVIEVLQVYRSERERLYFRPGSEGTSALQLELEIGEVQASDLASVLQQLLAKALPDLTPPELKAGPSIAEVMAQTLSRLDTSRWSTIGEIMPMVFSKTEAVYIFLALLELIRLGQVAVELNDQKEVLFARIG
ncbi:MAG: segregation/condensation protein A [Rhabdochlamydiaceae bacterium]